MHETQQRKTRFQQPKAAIHALAIAAAITVSPSLTSHHALAEPLPVLPTATSSIEVDGLSEPTRAWIKFCEQAPAECEVDRSQAEIIALTPRTWGAIIAANLRVNSAIMPVTDQEHWGVEDRWDYPDDGKGDCEDIQLLKRKHLVQEGFSRRALRMTVVLDEAGAGHAVLMVRTDRGDLILDNKRNIVLPWKQTGYTFIKREGSDGTAWVWLGQQGVSVVTAAQ
jgi:predicted transglutaminase-like cysteine proteinase